eukprot:m.267252 g.267252  ORF g.267252 m.267252 type:complete len:226 (-) comp72012_c0_seq1:34-711(-)
MPFAFARAQAPWLTECSKFCRSCAAFGNLRRASIQWETDTAIAPDSALQTILEHLVYDKKNPARLNLKVPMLLATTTPTISRSITLYRFTDILQFLDVITITAIESSTSSKTCIVVTSESVSLLPSWVPLPLHVVALLLSYLPWLFHDWGANYSNVRQIQAALAVHDARVTTVETGGFELWIHTQRLVPTLVLFWNAIDQATKFFAVYILSPVLTVITVVLVSVY